MLLRRSLALLFVAASVTCEAGELRFWKDATGEHQVEAEFVSADGSSVTLRRKDGKELHIALEKLSGADRNFVEHAQFGVTDAAAGGSVTTENLDKEDDAASSVATYRDLEKLIKRQREASMVVNLMEGFLADNSIDSAEKAKAREKLSDWQQLAQNDGVRVGFKWVSANDFRQMKEDEIQLIKQAHRLIDIKNYELARDKFLEASKANPQAVRADFYLGLLNALIAHHRPSAKDHFQECIKRLARDEDLLTETRKANYVAALNNLAIIEVRRHQYDTAIGYWRRAIEIAPFTPELVQNLGLMSKFSQSRGTFKIPKGPGSAAGNLYSQFTVENNLGRFDDRVGWLFIPYIDTLDGSMDSSGDEELVTIGWCTGFCVGRDYVLTSRYPLADADRVVVRDGGNAFDIRRAK